MTCHHVLAALALLAGLSAAPVARAQGDVAEGTCQASIDRIELRASPRYLPFSGEMTELPLEVGLADADGCQLSLTFRSIEGGRLRGTGEPLQYQLSDDSGRILRTDASTRVPVRSAAVPGAPSMLARLTLAPGQTVSAGRYSDRLFVQLLEADRVIDEREIELAVDVQAQASIALAGNAAAGFSRATFGGGLDFGDLAPGKEREALLFVLSNTAYALRFTSANRGSLRHVSDMSAPNTIGYTARLDGRALDLATTAMVDGRDTRRFISLPPYRLNVRIGDVSGRPAGQYRDVITVDVVILE